MLSTQFKSKFQSFSTEYCTYQIAVVSLLIFSDSLKVWSPFCSMVSRFFFLLFATLAPSTTEKGHRWIDVLQYSIVCDTWRALLQRSTWQTFSLFGSLLINMNLKLSQLFKLRKTLKFRDKKGSTMYHYVY